MKTKFTETSLFRKFLMTTTAMTFALVLLFSGFFVLNSHAMTFAQRTVETTCPTNTATQRTCDVAAIGRATAGGIRVRATAVVTTPSSGGHLTTTANSNWVSATGSNQARATVRAMTHNPSTGAHLRGSGQFELLGR